LKHAMDGNNSAAAFAAIFQCIDMHMQCPVRSLMLVPMSLLPVQLWCCC
jgi:hypothetical protein